MSTEPTVTEPGPDNRVGYWYEHKCGRIIFQSPELVERRGVDDHFNSPFVVRYWWGYRHGPLMRNRAAE